ncbi:MAG: hypothetical protein CM15mP102_02120 [Flavobacteriales bacterium]|nr:MAG: hypothetical protein CM15mP102_02120 [Flavobacteriales bacterium]
MKKTLIALILLSTNFIFSQSVITGKVIDGEFNELLPFANVLLLTAEGRILMVLPQILMVHLHLKFSKELTY